MYPENNNNNLLKEIHIFFNLRDLIKKKCFFNICYLLLQIQILLLWGLCLEFIFIFLFLTQHQTVVRA